MTIADEALPSVAKQDVGVNDAAWRDFGYKLHALEPAD